MQNPFAQIEEEEPVVDPSALSGYDVSKAEFPIRRKDDMSVTQKSALAVSKCIF